MYVFSIHLQGNNKEQVYSFKYTVLDSSSGASHSRKEESNDEGAVKGSYEVEDPGCVIRRVEYKADSTAGFQVLNISRRSCESGEIIREDLPVEHWDKKIFGYKVLPSSETQRSQDQKTQRLVSTTVRSLIEEQAAGSPFDVGHVGLHSRRTPSINYLGDGNGTLSIFISKKCDFFFRNVHTRVRLTHPSKCSKISTIV